MKKKLFIMAVLVFIASLTLPVVVTYAQDNVTLTISLVNNPDQRLLLELSNKFEAEHPNIKLSFVTLPENELENRITTDITTKAGSFDIVQISNLDASVWGKNGWLAAIDDLMAQYPNNVQPNYNMDDIIRGIRLGLSYDGKLYAAPFYGESTMLFYNKKMFAAAGLKMPTEPTWDQVREFASKLNNPAKKQYGIDLRGGGSGDEIFAPLGPMINTWGGKWFDMNWQPQLTSKEWEDAVSFYVKLQQDYGVPGAAVNGFSECLTMMAQGEAAMWVDATVAAGFLEDPKQSKIVGNVGFAMAPYEKVKKGYHSLWAWAYAIPTTSQHQAEALQFLTWCTSKDYIDLVGKTYGWQRAPSGTRYSTYKNPNYLKAAKDFADLTVKSIESADQTDATQDKVPYIGIQMVIIPEFLGFATDVSTQLAAAMTGKQTVEQALSTSQDIVTKAMTDAGYIK
jgi:sorbitol/mannitol transport system substrate-binding protein